MKKVGASFEFSATDLAGRLDCHHLTALDRAVAEGALPKPKVWDRLLQVLSERGAAHEQSHVEHLTKAGLILRGLGSEPSVEHIYPPPTAAPAPLTVGPARCRAQRINELRVH